MVSDITQCLHSVLYTGSNIIMERMYKQRWATIQLISAIGTVPHLFKSINTKRSRHIRLEIQVLTWNRHDNGAWLNLSM
jgi:hypothetical protein